MDIEEKLNYKYYEHFMDFWLPIYRNQVLRAKYDNDKEELSRIYDNIDKHWSLQEYKNIIFNELGINHMVPDIDGETISMYFKHKRKKEKLYECANEN